MAADLAAGRQGRAGDPRTERSPGRAGDHVAVQPRYASSAAPAAGRARRRAASSTRVSAPRRRRSRWRPSSTPPTSSSSPTGSKPRRGRERPAPLPRRPRGPAQPTRLAGAGERPPGVRGVPRDRAGTVGRRSCSCWSRHRIVPVRLTELSIVEEAFDTRLNPIRAKVSLSLRVLGVHESGTAAGSAPSPSASTAASRRWRRPRVRQRVRPRTGGGGVTRRRAVLLGPVAVRDGRATQDRSPATAGAIVHLRRRFVPQPDAWPPSAGTPSPTASASTTSPPREPRRPDRVVAARRRQRRRATPKRWSAEPGAGAARHAARRESTAEGLCVRASTSRCARARCSPSRCRRRARRRLWSRPR